MYKPQMVDKGSLEFWESGAMTVNCGEGQGLAYR